jgi:hypothetical protein
MHHCAIDKKNEYRSAGKNVVYLRFVSRKAKDRLPLWALDKFGIAAGKLSDHVSGSTLMISFYQKLAVCHPGIVGSASGQFTRRW